MSKKNDRAELLADRLGLPSDALGSTKLSLCGRSRLLIENHRGIISYGENVTEIACGGAKLVFKTIYKGGSGNVIHVHGTAESQV